MASASGDTTLTGGTGSDNLVGGSGNDVTLTYVGVNVAPSNLVLNLVSGTINEGQSASLSGTFDDANVEPELRRTDSADVAGRPATEKNHIE